MNIPSMAATQHLKPFNARMMTLIWRALKPGGYFYATYKTEGEEGRDALDRYYRRPYGDERSGREHERDHPVSRRPAPSAKPRPRRDREHHDVDAQSYPMRARAGWNRRERSTLLDSSPPSAAATP